MLSAMSESKQITVYSAQSMLRSPAKAFDAMIRDAGKSRELAWRLAVRDISAQYRQSVFGFLWAVLLPLAHASVWIFLGSSGIVRVGSTDVPYTIYVLAGTLLWAIFTDAVNAPLQTTIAAKAMLAKINFPREALILAGLYQTLFNAAIKVFLLLVALPLFSVAYAPSLLLFPLAIASLVVVGTAIGLLVTPIGVLYNDVGRSIPLLLQFLMYFTPVVFIAPKSGWSDLIFQLNPLTPLIITARQWLTGGAVESLGYFLAVNVVAAGILLVAWAAYRIAMPILIERMSS